MTLLRRRRRRAASPGPTPKRVQGKWSIDLWLFSISKSFDNMFGDDRPPRRAAAGRSAARSSSRRSRTPRNWTAPLPRAGAHARHASATAPARRRARAPARRRSACASRSLPLGIEHRPLRGRRAGGRAALRRSRRRPIGGQPVAPALPAAERALRRRASSSSSATTRSSRGPRSRRCPRASRSAPQGLDVRRRSAATASHAADSEIDFDDDRRRRRRPSAGGRGVLSGSLATVAAEFGPAGALAAARARDGAVRARRRAFSSARSGSRSRASTTSRRSTAPRAPAVLHAPSRRRSSGTCQANPGDRGRLQVVPAFRAEGPRERPLPVPPVGAPGRGARRTATPDTLAPVLAQPGGKPLTALPGRAEASTTARRSTCRCGCTGPGDVDRDRPARGRSAPTRRRGTADFEPNYFACDRVRHARLPVAVHARGGRRERAAAAVARASSSCAAARTSTLRVEPRPAAAACSTRPPPSCPTWPSRGRGRTRRSSRPRRAEPVAAAAHVAARAQNLSRLICPRRLEPATRYLACVVPAFEAGRKAGLGRRGHAPTTRTSLAPAWDGDAARSCSCPSTTTGSSPPARGGDFETPRAPADGRGRSRPTSGAGRCASATSRSGCPTPACSQFEGALVAPAADPPAPPPTRLPAARCARSLNLARRAGRHAAGLRQPAGGARDGARRRRRRRRGCAS